MAIKSVDSRDEKEVVVLCVTLVAGARPNFMKIAPIIRKLEERGLRHKLVHTGQHYDYEMSKIFFEELSLPDPDYYLGVGSGSHTYQTAQAMLGLEKVYEELKPQLVVVVGDVNSTLAGALAAAKSGIPVAHVEAGLRSFDRTMPEEINRILTDVLSDYLFTTCREADDNLIREGVPREKIYFVGNVMIDTLIMLMKPIKDSSVVKKLGLVNESFIYMTLHRPSNVDNPLCLQKIAEAMKEVVEMGFRVVFSLHPRTRHNLVEYGLLDSFSSIPGLILTQPMSYTDSIALVRSSKLVITDSGGLQEETTFLGVPCLTLRPNTERPITITEGTNVLLDKGPQMIPNEVKKILQGRAKKGRIPELWDGNAAERIVTIIEERI